MKLTKIFFSGYFLLMTFVVLIGITSCTKTNISQIVRLEAPERPAGQENVLQLSCDPIPTVRVAFIGLGSRGSEAVRRFMYLEGIEVVAICDINKDFVAKTQELLAENNKAKALEFTGKEDWKKVCELENVDLIYNCTHWALHTPIAVYAM